MEQSEDTGGREGKKSLTGGISLEINDLIRGLAGQMDPQLFLQAVKAECFPDGAASDAQLLMLLAVAAKRDLDPLAKEIFAFVNKKGKMTIGTGIDGWIKIAHRQPTFRGYKATEIRDDKGALVALKMQMFRSDWEHPGEYTAYLSEWNQKTDNWTAMPTHRLFDKAWHECARFTFAITDLVDREDIERIREADAKENVIYQPGPAQPRAIEHQPAEPANFIRPEQRERVEVHSNAAQLTGHLKVHVELPGEQPSAASVPPSEPPAAQESGARAETPATAPAPEAAKRRGRPAGSKNKPKDSGQAPVCWSCGRPSTRVVSFATGENFECCEEHDDPKPSDAKGASDERQADENQSAAPASADNAQETPPAAMAPDTSAAQAAAGLEHIDPAEHPLETFLRVHDVPRRRVDMALSKYGVTSLGELSETAKGEILSLFQKSYKFQEASA